MEDYKIDIQNTRKGCLGGSDGNMLAQIANIGYVPRSAYKRLAVMKGLVERDNVTTRVMRFGDFIEQSIFENLSANDERYQSNPLWISGKYSRNGVSLICHPDFVLFDEASKTLKMWECKATKYNPVQTRHTYLNQLFIEWTIANEVVKSKGEGWKVELFLCHYDTSGVDIEAEFEFDPSRLSMHRVRKIGQPFDIAKAMELVGEFADSFDYYTEDEEVDSQYLPQNVKSEFDTVTSILAEIETRKTKVEEFKRKLCDFMQEKGIKSIKNEAWNITLVGATEQVSFDSKKFLSEMSAEHPIKAKRLRKKYEKRTAKGAYVMIKLHTKKENNE